MLYCIVVAQLWHIFNIYKTNKDTILFIVHTMVYLIKILCAMLNKIIYNIHI